MRLSPVLVAFLCATAPARAEEITVFAAASLKSALDVIAADWQAETGNTVLLSYGGSAALARQISEGAPAQVFISAAEDWMDTLENDGLIVAESRADILGNQLVLIGHGHDRPAIELGEDFDLKGLIGEDKLAMGLVASVPAGQYGKAALETLGLWDSVKANVVESENVRAALSLVALGEAGFGIVYASDAVADDAEGDAVSVLATFPEASHPPIRYPAALVKGAEGTAAADFLTALSGDKAKAVFRTQGFSLPGDPGWSAD
jgi:molybdate transport system substrate-binding protein